MVRAKKYIVIVAFIVFTAIIISSILILANRGRQEEIPEEAYEEITMILPTYGYVPENMDKVVDALNEISIKKAGVKVNYIYVGSSELNHSCMMRLKAGEQIDLMPVLENESLTQLMEENLLTPLNELIISYAPEIMELTYPKIWDVLGTNGDIYAVSVGGKLSDWGGVILMKDVVQAADVDISSIEAAIADAENLDNVRKIDHVITPILEYCRNSKEQLPDGSLVSEKQLTPGLNGYQGVFSQMPVIDYDGYGNLLGVTLGTDDTIVNLFETQGYAQQIELLKKWENQGFIYHIQSTIDEDPAIVYNRRDAIGFFSSLGEDHIIPGSSIDRDNEIYIPFIKNKLTSDFFRVGTWVIPNSSEHSDAAMKILRLMYSDEEYIRTYHGEIEGVEDFNAPLAWLFGNSLLATENYDVSLAARDAYADMEFSKYFGFVYQAGENAPIIEQLQLILDEYLPLIENGIVEDVQKTLDEMNGKLYAAGLQTILDDKQSQLDAWILNHKEE